MSIENKKLLFLVKGQWLLALVLMVLIIVSGIVFYNGTKDLYASGAFIIQLAAIAVFLV